MNFIEIQKISMQILNIKTDIEQISEIANAVIERDESVLVHFDIAKIVNANANENKAEFIHNQGLITDYGSFFELFKNSVNQNQSKPNKKEKFIFSQSLSVNVLIELLASILREKNNELDLLKKQFYSLINK